MNLDFDYELDFIPGGASLILGGESRDPEAVLAALEKAREKLEKQGLDGERFRLAKRASLGARLRGLEDFENVCFALAAGTLDGYCALEGLTLLESIDKADCERFLLDVLRPERLALAICEAEKEA